MTAQSTAAPAASPPARWPRPRRRTPPRHSARDRRPGRRTPARPPRAGCARKDVAETVAEEEVVAEDQGAWRAAEEGLADQEGVRQAPRLGLHGVGEAHPPVGPVAEHPLHQGRVLGRGDDQHLADPGQHQGRNRVVDHRLVVDGQELFADRPRHRRGAACPSRRPGRSPSRRALQLGEAGRQALAPWPQLHAHDPPDLAAVQARIGRPARRGRIVGGRDPAHRRARAAPARRTDRRWPRRSPPRSRPPSPVKWNTPALSSSRSSRAEAAARRPGRSPRPRSAAELVVDHARSPRVSGPGAAWSSRSWPRRRCRPRPCAGSPRGPPAASTAGLPLRLAPPIDRRRPDGIGLDIGLRLALRRTRSRWRSGRTDVRRRAGARHGGGRVAVQAERGVRFAPRPCRRRV